MCKYAETEGRVVIAWAWRGRRGWGKEEWLLNYTRFSEGRWKCSKIRLWWWCKQNTVNILKTTELYSFKGWTLWYVNHFSKLAFFFFFKKEVVITQENLLRHPSYQKILLLEKGYLLRWKVPDDLFRDKINPLCINKEDLWAIGQRPAESSPEESVAWK